ncbi:TPA: hypothetical protein N0F65_007145 [Lagenidium giganteum]|uniref:Cdc23 domain-containing protein n=1 Tax=Lagenidium giganteum TaxID=4803 RepID=A0AAV2YY66_9STRA|nr:TPA: hypothetical protein N0F65_007145 [Lagenidium giganteum]
MGGEMEETHAIVSQLRSAVRELRVRGIKHAAKFAAELLLGVPPVLRSRVRAQVSGWYDEDDVQDGAGDGEHDRYEAAKASFDMGDYRRAHHVLRSGLGGAASLALQPALPAAMSKKAFFLLHYALYLAGEKTKEEVDLETSVTGATKEMQANTTRNGVNPHLKELYLSLGAAYQKQQLDGFGLYLFAVVLKRLGYATTSGRTSMDDRDSPVKTAGSNAEAVPMRSVLIDAIAQYPWNWSAWMELAAQSPFTTDAENAVLSRACPWMFRFFQAHVLLEQQQNDGARQLLDHLQAIFPHSTYILAQKALTCYHMRDFDQAQEHFEALALVDPYRVETMDVYSNVLYVKEDKTELSRLAHRMLRVDKYRPETCCIIGNYYSLKNDHERAIVYFHRALKLDPNFLSAWTLIGHEYVELKNTSAAIDAYRHAVDLNERDYRAWYGLGQAYEILNMYLYSIYYYRKAAAIRPYDARMWCALGGCYEKLNKSSEAIACFKRAVGNQDREGLAAYQLGRIFALRNQQHEAARYYQVYLGLRELPTTTESELKQEQDKHLMPLPPGHAKQNALSINVDTPQALGAILFLANYYKQMGCYTEAGLFCNRLLDLQGPEKEEAKALLREMRSLEAAAAVGAPRS